MGILSSASVNTCRLIRMAPCGKVLLVLLAGGHCIFAARQLRNPAATRRDGKSLVNTFPFNANGEEDHHHGHHEEHAEKSPSQSLGARDQRQDDDVVQCDHSYDKRCHTTYTTNYESQQEEECEENFRKNCFIEYEKIAFDETVAVCRTPLVKDCDVQGPEICKTEYESECWTKQEVHNVEDDVVECKTILEEKCQDETSGYTTNTKCSKWPKEVCNVTKKKVKKYPPITACTKEPRQLCAPAGCGFRQGQRSV